METLGMPQYEVEFKKKSDNFIRRSAQGIVCIILKDKKLAKGKLIEYNSFKEIKAESMDAENYDLLKLCYKGKPRKVMVMPIDDYEVSGEDSKITLAKALDILKFKRFNYLTVPGILKKHHETLVTWVETHREFYRPTHLILSGYSNESGKRFVYNWSTDNVYIGEKKYSAADFCIRLAGVLAGVPVNESVTRYELEDVTSADMKEDEDRLVNKGEIFLTTDGDSFYISRGVTSLQRVSSDEDIEDFRKIKISETADMIYQDIKDTWQKKFVGKFMNVYRNKLVFIAAVRDYLESLEKIDVLDTAGDNRITIDIDENRKYLEEVKKVKVDDYEEARIKEANTGSFLFCVGSLLIADALEDLKMKFYM